MPLRARDVMQPKVLTVEPDTPVPDLVDFLISRRVSGVPVVDGGKVVGVVSRSDLVRAVSLERALAGFIDDAFGQDAARLGAGSSAPLESVLPRLQGRTVREIMAPHPISVPPETPIDEVARVLVENHMHRVLVTEGPKLLGLISSLDVVRLLADGKVAEISA